MSDARTALDFVESLSSEQLGDVCDAHSLNASRIRLATYAYDFDVAARSLPREEPPPPKSRSELKRRLAQGDPSVGEHTVPLADRLHPEGLDAPTRRLLSAARRALGWLTTERASDAHDQLAAAIEHVEAGAAREGRGNP